MSDCPTCPREGRPNHTEGYVCSWCGRRGSAAVTELPVLYVALHGALGGASSTEDVRVDLSPDPSVPIAMAVWTAMEEMETWAIDVEETVRSQLDLTWRRPPRRRSVRFSQATVTLRRQWDQAIGTAIAVDLVRGALRQRGRAYRVLGWDTLIHELPAPCPACDLMTLVRYDGDDHVVCRNCHNAWPEEDYTRLTIILADEARRTGSSSPSSSPSS